MYFCQVKREQVSFSMAIENREHAQWNNMNEIRKKKQVEYKQKRVNIEGSKENKE